MASNQRARLYGAIAHSVACRGYEATSVADVIKLAGVSRTTFYQHFANKQECFWAAYDTMAYRMARNVNCGWRTSEDWRGALDGAFAALRSELVHATSAARMVIFAPARVRPKNTHRIKGVFEQMLEQTLSQSPAGPSASKVLTRGIIGGMRGVLYRRLYPQNAAELGGVIDELEAWTLSYHLPGVESCLGGQFEGRAQRDLASSRLTAAEWPIAIREILGALTGFIRADPTRGQLSLMKVSQPYAGIDTELRELLEDFSILLREGYEICELAPSTIVCEAIVGAVWENIHHLTSHGESQLLQGVTDELLELALTPFLGVKEIHFLGLRSDLGATAA